MFQHPKEQFFHTDYRPLMRDNHHYVVDEQSQLPPHLLPPPYLVDIDGHAHPIQHQEAILRRVRPVGRVKLEQRKEELEDYDEYMKKHLARVKQESFGFGRARQLVGVTGGVASGASVGDYLGTAALGRESGSGLGAAAAVSGEGVASRSSLAEVASGSGLGVGVSDMAGAKEGMSHGEGVSQEGVSREDVPHEGVSHEGMVTDDVSAVPREASTDGRQVFTSKSPKLRRSFSISKDRHSIPNPGTGLPELGSPPFFIPVPNNSGGVFATVFGRTSGSNSPVDQLRTSIGRHQDPSRVHSSRTAAAEGVGVWSCPRLEGGSGDGGEACGRSGEVGGEGVRVVGTDDDGGGGEGSGKGNVEEREGVMVGEDRARGVELVGEGQDRARDVELVGEGRQNGQDRARDVELVEVVEEGSQDGQNIQNMLSSLVYSLGLNEVETKQVISLWHNRVVIPPLDSAFLSAELAKREQFFREEHENFELQNRQALLRDQQVLGVIAVPITPIYRL